MIISPKSEYQNLSYGSQKRLRAECDDCGKQYEVMYRNYYKSQQKRGWSGQTFCSSCAVKKSNQNRDYNSKNYYISGDGYKMVKIGKKKNGVGWTCYEKEHKIIAEKRLGRKLNKKEIVHHIDGNKLNNEESNLHICYDHTEHRLSHTSLQDIGYELYKKGLLNFDTKTGKYVANVKLRELLEHPEEDNQQPSLSSNTSEGSTTSSES